MFISTENATILAGVSLGAVAVRQVFDGESVSFPGFAQADVLGFWLPLTGAVLLLAPGIIPISGRNKRMIGAAIALFVGGRALFEGNTALTVDNAIKGYLPALGGLALVA